MHRIQTLRPIFIVGSSKSGTTFLQALFDSHPNLLSLRETALYYFPDDVGPHDERFLTAVERHFEPRLGIIHKGLTLAEVTGQVQWNLEAQNS